MSTMKKQCEVECSSLGMGTYLGPSDALTDARYTASARIYHARGGTVFDTAANYRGGRSELALGEAFRDLPRESFFVSTKAGYLPMGDGRTRESPAAWFDRVLTRPGILNLEDVVGGCHAMTPEYLEHQLQVSRVAMGVECVDCFHLHNPEQQRPALGPEAFRAMLRRAFEACEGFAQSGRIRAYGCATWNGFRVPPDSPEHLDLEELLALAQDVGGSRHHFRWIQLPLNLAMPQALCAPTQRFGGRMRPVLEAASLAGLKVQASASLMQARILDELPREFLDLLECETPAQAALQFTRSCPGVTTALCGMSSPEHVQENLALLPRPRLEAGTLMALVAEAALTR